MKNTIIIALSLALISPSITMSASVRASGGFRSSSYRQSSRVTPVRSTPVKTVTTKPVTVTKKRTNTVNASGMASSYSYNPISSNFFLWWWILGNNRHASTTLQNITK